MRFVHFKECFLNALEILAHELGSTSEQTSLLSTLSLQDNITHHIYTRSEYKWSHLKLSINIYEGEAMLTLCLIDMASIEPQQAEVDSKDINVDFYNCQQVIKREMYRVVVLVGIG